MIMTYERQLGRVCEFSLKCAEDQLAKAFAKYSVAGCIQLVKASLQLEPIAKPEKMEGVVRHYPEYVNCKPSDLFSFFMKSGLGDYGNQGECKVGAVYVIAAANILTAITYAAAAQE